MLRPDCQIPSKNMTVCPSGSARMVHPRVLRGVPSAVVQVDAANANSMNAGTLIGASYSHSAVQSDKNSAAPTATTHPRASKSPAAWRSADLVPAKTARHALTRGVHHPEVELRLGVTVLCDWMNPGGEFLVGAGADVCWLVECAKFCTDGFDCSEPEAGLRLGVTLLCGFAVPGDGFRGILRDAEADGIPQPEVVLRVGVSLRSGQAVPGDCFSVILRHAFTCGVHQPEGELRRGVASLGDGAQVGEFLC